MDKIIDLDTVKMFANIERDDLKGAKIKKYEYKGVCFVETGVTKDTLESMPKWEARPDDVFVASFPKAGTTWTQEIAYLALNGGDVERAKQSHTMLRIPFLEAAMSPPKLQWFSRPLWSLSVLWVMLKMMFRLFLFNIKKGQLEFPSIENIYKLMPSPRLMKSHLPEHLLPPDAYKKKAKIIYVARNPKDIAVSYYHFHLRQPQLPFYDSWDEFFDDFVTGKDHILGFWKRRHEGNILFLKYEDMKKDEKAAVTQICEFLGYHYSDDILQRITEYCGFGNMKENPMTNPDSFGGLREEAKHISFMRKGVVGDWKNYFTDAQNETFDALYEEKLAGTGLEFEFE